MELTLCEETLGANVTTEEDLVVINPGAGLAPNSVLLHAKVVVAADGGECDAYVQTRIAGAWVDVADFHATTASLERFFNLSTRTPVTTIGTPTAATLTDNTAVDGLIGDVLRVKLVTSGSAYTGASSIKVVAVVR